MLSAFLIYLSIGLIFWLIVFTRRQLLDRIIAKYSLPKKDEKFVRILAQFLVLSIIPLWPLWIYAIIKH